MAVMYSFCFWFSVRLGSIIVGVVSLLQTAVALVFCGMGVVDPQSVSDRIGYWLDTYNLLYMESVLKAIKSDPADYFICGIVFLCMYAISCFLLIMGAFQCNLLVIYPYLGLDLMRLMFVSINFVFLLMIIKENVLDLGVIIGLSIAGGFALLYLFYMWFCTVSLCQIVKELKQTKDRETPVATKAMQNSHSRKQLAVGIGDYRRFNHNQFAISRPTY